MYFIMLFIKNKEEDKLEIELYDYTVFKFSICDRRSDLKILKFFWGKLNVGKVTSYIHKTVINKIIIYSYETKKNKIYKFSIDHV